MHWFTRDIKKRIKNNFNVFAVLCWQLLTWSYFFYPPFNLTVKFSQSTFTFSGKKMLHLQENVALTRKSCKCNIFLPMQDLLTRKSCQCNIFLPMQDLLTRKSCQCNIFLPMQDLLTRKSCKCNIFLPMQHFLANARFLPVSFVGKRTALWRVVTQPCTETVLDKKSCQCAIFLQMQHFLANATFSCKCNIFLQIQHFLATKCKGAD